MLWIIVELMAVVLKFDKKPAKRAERFRHGIPGESGERLGGLDEADEEFVVPCGDLAPQSD